MKKVLYILLVLSLALVGCKKQPYVEVDRSSLSVSSAGATEQITVSANNAWSATTTDAWIKVKYSEGNNVLMVTIRANPDPDSRQGTILIKSEDVTTTVTVSQDQRDAIELDSSGSLMVSAEAQQVEVRLRSNVDMTATVEEGSDWVSVVSTKAMTSRAVTLAVSANSGRSIRRARLSFKDKTGAVSRQFVLEQDIPIQSLLVTFRDVISFRVPLLEGPSGTSSGGTVFWNGETQGIPYEWPLSRTYDGSAGSLRIDAKGVETVTFSDVRGIDSIDLSKF